MHAKLNAQTSRVSEVVIQDLCFNLLTTNKVDIYVQQGVKRLRGKLILCKSCCSNTFVIRLCNSKLNIYVYYINFNYFRQKFSKLIFML